MDPKLVWKHIGTTTVIILAITICGWTKANVMRRNLGSGPAKGAVVTNGEQCATIGRDILAKNGTAVDAAIAALICEGIALPESLGVGGGFLMTIYNRTTNRASFLIAREAAPLAAKTDMFKGNRSLAAKGIFSGAVPGELKGYYEAYKKHGGGLKWADLIEPSIKLCEQGIPVSPYLEHVLYGERDQIFKDEGLRSTFINISTNETFKIGEIYQRKKLAETLKELAKDGDSFYNGILAHRFIKDVSELGGIITLEDLQSYTVEWQKPITMPLPGGRTLYTATFPGSGVILAYILNILKGLVLDENPEDVNTYHMMIEAFKFGYAKRTKFADLHFLPHPYLKLENVLLTNEFAEETRRKISVEKTSQDLKYYGLRVTVPDDFGTANLNILAPNGDAVAVTSTINTYFGSGILLKRTGIILNDEMDDFSSPDIINEYGVPPSKNNYIVPRKRPLSSMSPSIIVKDEHAELVIGAAGGTMITTAVAQTIIRHLWYNMSINEAIQTKRFHHQLLPMNLVLEPAFNEPDTKYLLEGLAAKGHKITIFDAHGFSAVTAISNKTGFIEGSFDTRRQGQVAYLT